MGGESPKYKFSEMARYAHPTYIGFNKYVKKYTNLTYTRGDLTHKGHGDVGKFWATQNYLLLTMVNDRFRGQNVLRKMLAILCKYVRDNLDDKEIELDAADMSHLPGCEESLPPHVYYWAKLEFRGHADDNKSPGWMGFTTDNEVNQFLDSFHRVGKTWEFQPISSNYEREEALEFCRYKTGSPPRSLRWPNLQMSLPILENAPEWLTQELQNLKQIEAVETNSYGGGYDHLQRLFLAKKAFGYWFEPRN